MYDIHNTASQLPCTIPESLIDPSLFTPSKRGLILTQTLAKSDSAYFLVGSSKITSLQTIPTPVLEGRPKIAKPNWSLVQAADNLEQKTRRQLEADIRALTESLCRAQIWDRAQESVIEGANAQLVVQNMYCTKLNEALNTKEKEKNDDRTCLFPDGKGRHLTDPEFIKERADLTWEREEQAAAKEQRKLARDAKKKRKEAFEKLWTAKKADYDELVEGWKEECERLKAGGSKKKDLPPKPKMPLKSTVQAEFDEEYEEEEASEDEGSFENDEFEG